MDVYKEKFIQALDNELFIDLVLQLNDVNGNKKELKVHKIILYASCLFFEKMLASKLKEGTQDIIPLYDLPDVYITSNIIMQFYGKNIKYDNYSKWFRTMLTYKCYNYFMLEFDTKKLDGLIIPNDEFDILLDLVDQIGYNDATINLLIKNLPNKFDYSKLHKNILKKIIGNIETLFFTVSNISKDCHVIKRWIINNNKLSYVNFKYYGVKPYICFSPDNKYMVVSDYSQVYLYNTDQLNSCKVYDVSPNKITWMDFFDDDTLLFYNSSKKQIGSLNIKDYQISYHFIVVAGCFSFSSKIKQFVVSSKDGTGISIINLSIDLCLISKTEINCQKPIFLTHSPDGSIFLSLNNDYEITLFDSTDGNILNKIVPNIRYQSVYFNTNYKIIVNQHNSSLKKKCEKNNFIIFSTKENINKGTVEYWKSDHIKNSYTKNINHHERNINHYLGYLAETGGNSIYFYKEQMNEDGTFTLNKILEFNNFEHPIEYFMFMKPYCKCTTKSQNSYEPLDDDKIKVLIGEL